MHKILDVILNIINLIICLFILGNIFSLYPLNIQTIYGAILILPFFFVWQKIHIAIHEVGRLIAGRISGYTFQQVRIGAFAIYKDASGTLRFSRLKLRAIGGQCLMNPPVTEAEQCPCILYLLGGSLLNLFIGISNLLPHKFRGFLTDGYQIMILNSDPTMK